jgi:sec-independent protein translocase protein TatC
LDTATSPGQPDTAIPWHQVIDRIDRVRRSLVWVVLVLLGGTALSWNFADRAFALLARPLTTALLAAERDPRLIFTSLTEPFVIYFSIALLGGFTLALPLLMGLTWRLIAPISGGGGLLKALGFAGASTILFLLGLAFGYLVLLPFVVNYLLGVAIQFEYALTIREYLKFTLRLLLAMGIAAQLPLISFTLARLGLVTAHQLLRWLPYSVLAAFVLAALITPPDGVSQVLVAVPMLVLYLVGVAVAALARRRG